MSTPGYGAKSSITTSAAALAASTVVRTGVVVKALSTNTGTVYVGNSSSVDNTTGFPLAAGESQAFDAGWMRGTDPAGNADLANVYVYGSAAGQEVRFAYA